MKMFDKKRDSLKKGGCIVRKWKWDNIIKSALLYSASDLTFSNLGIIHTKDRIKQGYFW